MELAEERLDGLLSFSESCSSFFERNATFSVTGVPGCEVNS